MAVRELWVDGYRSIRALRLQLTPVTVVVGPNGCGKTNALRLLSAVLWWSKPPKLMCS